ncbi:hypothetical protein [Streptomyces sp. ISL-11]|uniref:hypothetical protein n=1 Tax=Streptomyces sp. ISL-11 TaxID=2819174 RepID=UPI001BE56F9E|nr:hypothetical protein [Streptomyces sp. ISL-11]MBT2384176.1 hypothetical protein [Streptomyces sp. ISL-11]
MSASFPSPPSHPYAPAPQVPRRWWQHPALVIALLVLFPPGGILLAWLGRWTTGKKVIATLLSGLWFLLILFSDPPKDTKDDSKPVAKPAAAASPSPTPSATPKRDAPSPTPTPTRDPVMPSVVNTSYAEALKVIKRLSGGDARALSAYTDVELPRVHDEWTVCFQAPAAGGKVVRTGTSAELRLVEPGTACPEEENTALHPKPTREPGPDPDNGSTGGGSTGGSSTSGGSGTSGGSSSSGGGTSGSGGSGAGVVHPGSYCSPAGATGVTKKGTPMVCGPASDGRNRWHS